MAGRDNQRKLEAWIDRDLFDALTDWCARNSVGSKAAWLESAIKLLMDFEAGTTTDPAGQIRYTAMILDARDAHARRTSSRGD